eukprot:jgi/Ulvmu1/3739/UM173_0012.1
MIAYADSCSCPWLQMSQLTTIDTASNGVLTQPWMLHQDTYNFCPCTSADQNLPSNDHSRIYSISGEVKAIEDVSTGCQCLKDCTAQRHVKWHFGRSILSFCP